MKQMVKCKINFMYSRVLKSEKEAKGIQWVSKYTSKSFQKLTSRPVFASETLYMKYGTIWVDISRLCCVNPCILFKSTQNVQKNMKQCESTLIEHVDSTHVTHVESSVFKGHSKASLLF